MEYSSFHLYNVEWTTRWNWIRVESWTDTCTPAIKTSAKVICERLGDRRSPKIIRVVRALTRTRSLRNCEIVVRNIAATIYHEILSWILHDRNSMHLSNPGWQNIGTVPTSGRSDQSLRSLATTRLSIPLPPMKNKLSSFEKFERTFKKELRYLLPLSLAPPLVTSWNEDF